MFGDDWNIMSKRLLEVRDLSFAYDKKTILHKINVSIQRGERIAVMGCNGAGKSTFLLNLNGVLQPDAGEIWFDDVKLCRKDYNSLRRRVGFVFQDSDSQLVASNVRAEISFGPMNMGLPREEVKRRVDEAVSYMSLEELVDRAPHYLSGGEKKRVAIADILAMEPELLIFDEPMAALDPLNAQNVEQILSRLHDEGKTLVIATHDVDFAYRFADRILVFADGELIADRKPIDIFHDEKILKQAHLRVPAVLKIWEALKEKKLVQETSKEPVTAEEAVQLLFAHV
jgi:cobalt/nickel transport system ATP-binding protein